ncbi:MAG: NifB/NifX family molybdenum-iron cluster-binding protein [Proteiniphilum sp.]|jgi:predicted Fe-Mo cluster-binding NifX family protein
MKQVIAIPLEEGRLCQHFGHCQQFAIIETEDGAIQNETLLTPPPHEPGLLPAWLAERGITEVIAAGIGQKAIRLFEQHNIKVHVGAEYKSPRELIIDHFKQSLVTGLNACDH